MWFGRVKEDKERIRRSCMSERNVKTNIYSTKRCQLWSKTTLITKAKGRGTHLEDEVEDEIKIIKKIADL